MLTVGEDSFVTLEEAEELVRREFTSNNSFRVSWDDLSDEDKEVLLRNSTFAICDSYKFIGRKAKMSQRLAFPRVTQSMPVGVYPLLFTSQLYDNSNSSGYGLGQGLEEAARAEVVNAVYGSALIDGERAVVESFSSGITSKTMGPISESYTNSNNAILQNSLKGIYTKKVETILSNWLTNSFFSF